MLETERLILRNWCADDRQPFAEMNADSLVMEFMPATLSTSESDLLVEKIDNHIQTHGFGLFAAELRASHSFIGFIGLSIPSFQARSTPVWRWAGDCPQFTGAKDWQPKVQPR